LKFYVCNVLNKISVQKLVGKIVTVMIYCLVGVVRGQREEL